MNEPWRVFAEHDRRVKAPLHLEARVLAAVASAPRSSTSRHQLLWFTSIAAATILGAVIASVVSSRDLPPVVIKAAALEPAGLAVPVAPRQPTSAVVGPKAPAPRSAAPLPVKSLVRPGDVPLVVMLFEAGPAQHSESLRRVRLRLPIEALQQLGLAAIEPNASGMVDLDMFVGEDGLPRDIRTVRGEQEGQ